MMPITTKLPEPKINNPNITDISDVKNHLNKVVEVIVNIDRTKEVLTKKGDSMCFITGSDNTGSISLTVFPDLYKTCNNFKKNEIIKVTGRVEKRFDEYQIVCTKIER